MTTGLIVAKRSIGSITADITIEESGTDELAITEHPVEQGAAIVDHAYKRPATLTLRVAWSNSSPQAGGDDGYVRAIYAKLLALQVKREPVDIVTGKRSYSNMLLRTVAMTTDESTEYALFCTVTCQEIIIVQTETTSVPPASDQASPEKTAATINTGTKQPIPVSEDSGGPFNPDAAG